MRKPKSFHLVFLLFEELQVYCVMPRGGRQLLPSACERHQQRSAESPQFHCAHSDLESPIFLCKCQNLAIRCQKIVLKSALGLSKSSDSNGKPCGVICTCRPTFLHDGSGTIMFDFRKTEANFSLLGLEGCWKESVAGRVYLRGSIFSTSRYSSCGPPIDRRGSSPQVWGGGVGHAPSSSPHQWQALCRAVVWGKPSSCQYLVSNPTLCSYCPVLMRNAVRWLVASSHYITGVFYKCFVLLFSDR